MKYNFFANVRDLNFFKIFEDIFSIAKEWKKNWNISYLLLYFIINANEFNIICFVKLYGVGSTPEWTPGWILLRCQYVWKSFLLNIMWFLMLLISNFVFVLEVLLFSGVGGTLKGLHLDTTYFESCCLWCWRYSRRLLQKDSTSMPIFKVYCCFWFWRYS